MSDHSQRLLMVAFHYPPDNTSTGVLRTLKFTQYLQEFNWYCDVLSVPETLYPSTDASAVSKIPETVRVHRVWAEDIKKVLSIRGIYPSFMGVPDRYWLWVLPALRQAKLLLRGDHNFKAIFSTYPVPSALLIGLLLKKRHGLPWIADFRDPWVEDSMKGYEKWLSAWIERKILEKADRVICNTPRMREWFMQRYPHVDARKLVTIPNGYDEEELSQVVPERLDKFQIFYGGVIDGENRNPRPLLAAARHAIEKGWIDEKQLHITFLGAGAYGTGNAFAQDVETFALKPVIELTEERIPYAQALCRAAGADVILVLSEALGDTEAAEKERQWSRLQVPVKVYEGLGMKRQILALVSGGAAKDILEETQAGMAIAPTDIEGIAQALKSLYERWQAGDSDEDVNEARLEKYSRKNLTGILAATLDELIEK
ncbi:MAG: glycosyltransferase family 4 protein [Ectothiorhodospiraceae bacterium]|nr:glycosyltransferase family 4 protein [Ectothiorhodospiraceae bacterium]